MLNDETRIKVASPQQLSTRLAESADALEPAITHGWALGDHHVEVRIWGTDHSPYVAALEPSRSNAGSVDPDFHIDVIDAKRTGIEWPGLRLERADFGRNRRLDRWSDERFSSFVLRTEKGLCIADYEQRRAIIWVPSIEAVPPHERAAPFRWLAESIAAQLDSALVHCAAIGSEGRAALVVGPGGAGKSTLALCALGEGWSYFSDDYALVSSLPEPRCWRLYRSAKWVRAATITPDWLDPDSGFAADGGGIKRMLFLTNDHPSLAGPSSRISLLIKPRIDPEALRPRATQVSPAKLAMSAVMSTMSQTEVKDAPSFGPIAEIARNRPCYELHLSRDLGANLALLGELLSE